MPAMLRLSLLVLLLMLAACDAEDRSDAYGNFEADETTISSEVVGELLRFSPDEGEPLQAGDVVGQVDTVQLVLERRQLLAQRAALRTRPVQTSAQVAVLREQRSVVERELERFRALRAAQAATQKQVDDLEGQVRVLDRQIQQVATQDVSIEDEVAQIDARLARNEDQLRRSRLVNPVAGTVLTTYVAPHEVVTVGQPLYRIADLDTLTLRAYVTGAQLPQLRLGRPVEVFVDAGGDSLRTLPGRITWIAAEAEFTPTPIQTREERADLVYAIEVAVPNPEGYLKIGMPGEVRWNRGSRGSGAAGRDDDSRAAR